MLEHSVYHSLLRIAALTCAIVLVFESGLLHSQTRALSHQTTSYVASVIGVSAGVTPNELNQFTAELSAQKRALDQREAALSEREIAVGLNEVSAGASPFSTLLLSAILFILLMLIILNYVLDFLRRPVLQKDGQTA